MRLKDAVLITFGRTVVKKVFYGKRLEWENGAVRIEDIDIKNEYLGLKKVISPLGNGRYQFEFISTNRTAFDRSFDILFSNTVTIEKVIVNGSLVKKSYNIILPKGTNTVSITFNKVGAADAANLMLDAGSWNDFGITNCKLTVA